MTALLARSKKLGGDTSQNNTFSNSSRKVSNTFLHMSTRENSVYQDWLKVPLFMVYLVCVMTSIFIMF